VRLDYGLRILGHSFFAAVALSVAQARPLPAGTLALMGAAALLWPHLAYQVASRSRNSKAAEQRNLLIDVFLMGVDTLLTGLDPWIGVVSFTAMNAANLSIGGVRLGLLGLGCFALGIAVAGLGAGFEPQPVPPLAHALTALAVIAYTAAFGLFSHVQTRRAIRTRNEVRARNQTILHQQADLELARANAERARDQAETANRAKSAFLANMSHELRTPLNAVIGYTELLAEELADQGPAEGPLADLGRIKGAAHHLLRMINDVLDLSKIEADKIELRVEPFEPAHLLDQVVSSTQPLLAVNRNSLHVRCEQGLGLVRSDLTRLRQVLINLVSNAAKFTRDGRVSIAATRGHDGDGHALVVFEVSDTGIGMTPLQLERLFQPFVQVDADTTRKYSGTGLGLVISRRLCRLLGGDVTASSTAGVGSQFRATVRANLAPAEAGAVAGSGAGD
jgi:signal transduction histidine kinase